MMVVEEELLRPQHELELVWLLDGKPLVIGGCSKVARPVMAAQREARRRGCKMPVISNVDGNIAAWRVAPKYVVTRRATRVGLAAFRCLPTNELGDGFDAFLPVLRFGSAG
jgi:hypothetical protein